MVDVTAILSVFPEALWQPEGWRTVLPVMTSHMAVPHILIAERDHEGVLQLDEASLESEFIHGYGDLRNKQDYLNYYSAFDLWDRFECGYNIDRGAVMVSDQKGHELGVSTEFWAWLNPLSINENAYMPLFHTPKGWLGINAHFDHNRADREHILKTLNALRKPFETCLRSQQFGLYENQNLEREMSASSIPKMLLRADGSVKFVNPAADRFVSCDQDLFRVNGSIRFESSKLQNTFKNKLRQAVETRLPQYIPHATADKCGFVISPIERSLNALWEPETLLMVSILDDSHYGPLVRPFAQAHGLTAREITILVELDKGKNLHEVADALGISFNHVRKVMYQEIFQKLRVGSVAELMGVLSNLHRTLI